MSFEEGSPGSDAPAEARRPRTSISAARLAVQLLDDKDRTFLEALQKAGLLSELDSEELLRVASEVEAAELGSRHADMLDIYYAASGNAEVSKRRRLADRYFRQKADEPTTAAGLVTRLAELTPELGSVRLERIGGGDGPLVLRAGEHFSAVLDDYEEETDTDQLDVKEIEARRGGPTMVTVRGLVRALNVLLDRHGVRDRLISLASDESREIYVGVGVSEAIQLANANLTDDEDTEGVMELGAW